MASIAQMAFWEHESIDSNRYEDVPLPSHPFHTFDIGFGLLDVASDPITVDDHRVAAAHSLFARDLPHARNEIQFDLAYATPTSIRVEEFLGPFYDSDSRQLTSTEEASIYDDLRDAAYAAVFSSPPFCHRGFPYPTDWQVLTEWFHEVNDVLFGGLDDDLEIYAWSTDWSEYFEAGEREAGAHCWTVRRPATHRIAGISNSWHDS